MHQGTLHGTFEEGVHSAWLYDLMQRTVAGVLVCDPRKDKLLKPSNKGDPYLTIFQHSNMRRRKSIR